MRYLTITLVVLIGSATALADTTYKVEPTTKIEEPARKERCDAATARQLDQIVQALVHMRIAKDGFYYQIVGGEFHKATRSLDNYGFVDNGDSTIVMAVINTGMWDRPHADRSKIMIGVIKRGKRPCSERWFGFGRLVTP